MNFLIGPAPSTEAAKKGYLGKDRRPANKSKNIKGVHCQTSTIIIVNFAKCSFVNQGGAIPNILKISLTGPNDT